MFDHDEQCKLYRLGRMVSFTNANPWTNAYPCKCVDRGEYQLARHLVAPFDEKEKVH